MDPSVDQLPPYVALWPWAEGRRVLVVGPTQARGVLGFIAGGATEVVALGSSLSFDATSGVVPVRDWADLRAGQSFDLILCIEPYASITDDARTQLLGEAAARLQPRGMFAAWSSATGEPGGVDFWALEGELRKRFGHLFMLAQLPWRGSSLAPVLEGDAPSPAICLDEGLLEQAPEATRYVAIALRDAPDASTRALLTERCVLVPMAGDADERSADLRAQAEVQTARISELETQIRRARTELKRAETRVREQETARRSLQGRVDANTATASQRSSELAEQLDRVRAESRKGQTDLAILSRSVQDLESALTLAQTTASDNQQALAQRDKELAAEQARAQSIEAERGSVTSQLEVAIAEREGARRLSDRVEAELALTRRRLQQHETQLAERAAEAHQLSTEVQLARAELEHQRSMLARSQSREEELSASAAQTVEQGRMLAEVAGDRERLREELTRRAQQIQSLEERLWASREDLEKARLDNVRLGGDAERLRERADRAHEAEAGHAKTIETLNRELHALEVARAELGATVRAQEQEIVRLRADAEAHAGDSGEVAALQAELRDRGRELGEASARAEQATAREQEARSVARKREEQLSGVGEELERLRMSAEENAATSVVLQSELDVRALEVEQLAASVSDLQMQLETRRQSLDGARGREDELQRELEAARSERESLRRRVREREQELEDISTANVTSGVELYKLRRELEAAALANEQLEEALDLGPQTEAGERPHPNWPEDASEAVRQLRGQLAAQSRRHAEQLAARARDESANDTVETRTAALRLEIEIRAEEQEHMLRELEAAEQKIWEMTDAADRNAARLAASLAQLEKHREELDETRDELEVGRKLLAAAEARALEQERLLASERARLARVGAEVEHRPFDEGIDDLFAELEPTQELVPLGESEEGAPVRHLRPPTGPKAVPISTEDSDADKPRVVVEAIEGDGGSDELWSKGVISAPSGSKAAGAGPVPAQVPGSSKKA